MNTHRIGLGLCALGLLWLHVSPAIGQTTASGDVKLDMPGAVALAHARELSKPCELEKRGTVLDDISRQQHRQRIFRDIAVGSEGPVAGASTGGAGTLRGFLGLLQYQRQIANAQQTLDVERRMLTRLEADQTAGLIDIAQVDICRQSIQTVQAELRGPRVSLESAMDELKVDQLGLPKNVSIVLDDSMIRQFDLVDSRADALQTSLAELRASIVDPEVGPTVEQLTQATDRLAHLRAEIGAILPDARADLDTLDAKADARIRTMTDDERRFDPGGQMWLAERRTELKSRFTQSLAAFDASQACLVSATMSEAAQRLTACCDCLSNLTWQISLVRSLARLEAITIEPIEISSVDALKIAHSHRLDLLSQCAALSEMRQSIAGHENADDVAAYRKARRALVQAEDCLNMTLRQDLRVLKQLGENLEIQRMTAAICMFRVADAWGALNESGSAAHPGKPIATQGRSNPFSALQGLRDSEDNLLAVYLHYYKNRIDLYQHLGVMRFDERGMWVDEPIDRSLAEVEPIYAVPPEIAQPRLDDRDEHAVTPDVSSKK